MKVNTKYYIDCIAIEQQQQQHTSEKIIIFYKK